MIQDAAFDFSLLPVLFLISTSVGFFLSLVLWLKRSANTGNVFLSVLILLFSVSIADSVLYWSDYYLVAPDLLGISLSFALFFGPLFYAYARASLNNKGIGFRQIIVHVLPGLAYFLYLIKFHFTFGPAKLDAIQAWYLDPVNMLVAPAAKVLSLGIYAWLTQQWLKKAGTRTPAWLRNASRLFIAYTLLLVLYNSLVVAGVLRIQWDYLIAAAMVVFIYYIGYLGFSNSKLMEGLKQSEKYKSTTLTSTASDHIYEKLKAHLIADRPYLNPELRLSNLAEQLSLTTHQLSQVINERGKMNFAELINSYRIEEAKTMILQGNKTIDVAFAVGFNNKTSFYEAFKRFTGLAPNELKKQHQMKVSHKAS